MSIDLDVLFEGIKQGQWGILGLYLLGIFLICFIQAAISGILNWINRRTIIYRLPEDRKPTFLEQFLFDFINGSKRTIQIFIWGFLLFCMTLGVFFMVSGIFHLPWNSAIRTTFFHNFSGDDASFEFYLAVTGTTLFLLSLVLSLVASFMIAHITHSNQPAVMFLSAVKLFGGWIILGMSFILLLLSIFGASQFPVLIAAPFFLITFAIMSGVQAINRKRRKEIRSATTIPSGREWFS